jgi:hypothetical protein
MSCGCLIHKTVCIIVWIDGKVISVVKHCVVIIWWYMMQWRLSSCKINLISAWKWLVSFRLPLLYLLWWAASHISRSEIPKCRYIVEGHPYSEPNLVLSFSVLVRYHVCYIFVHLMKHVSYVHHIEGYYRIWPLSFVNYCRCTDMYVCVCVCVGGDTLCDQWVNRKCSHSGSTRSVQELPCLFTLCILYLLFYSVSQHCRPSATLWRCKAGRGCFVQTDGRAGWGAWLQITVEVLDWWSNRL